MSNIGSERDGAGRFFPGAISQVEIFNRALIVAEISSINKAGPSLTPTPTPTPTPVLQLNGQGLISVSATSRAFILTDIEMVKATNYFVGEFSYQDKAAKLSFSTGLLTSVTIAGNTATFSGTTLTEGTFGKKITFTVNVTANQSPALNDTLSISCSNGYSASDN